MQRYAFMLAGLLALTSLACKHDPYIDPTNPVANSACDMDTAYFQNQVLPILVSNCTQSGCHNPQSRRSGVVLDTYQSLLLTVDNVTSNDWNKNKLMRVINNNNPDDRMPPPQYAALTQEQINLIGKWVSQGALNNICDENFGTCDATTSKYSSYVLPLIQAKCQGCHSGNAPQGGIKLSNYSEIKTQALNGQLYNSLVLSSSWMPKGGSKLDDCSLQKIQFWIDSGAPQN